MPSYNNFYLSLKNDSFNDYVSVGVNTQILGEPDITLTWCKDSYWQEDGVNNKDFRDTIKIGDNCYIESRDILAFPNTKVKLTSVKVNEQLAGKITIGAHVVIQGTSIVAYESVTIKNHVIFGPGVTIMDSDGHPLLSRGNDDEAERIKSKPVMIEEHAWIGKGATILKGVTVGQHSIVGTNSVVTRDVPPYCVVIGNPAKVVKRLK